MFRLTEPNSGYESSYHSYIEELGASVRVPFPLNFPFDDFTSLLARLNNNAQGIGLSKGFVANTTYWLIEHAEIVGVSNLRHRLTEPLTMLGGHIGFGVRPSAQGRGVGQELLRQTLLVAAKMQIKRVLLTCDKNNMPSASVIRANGGRLDAEYVLAAHIGEVQRYFINT